MNRYWTAYGVSTGLVLASPFLYVMFGQRRKAGAPPNPNPAFQLPRTLSDAKTWFQTYGLTYDCGQVVVSNDGEGFITLQTPDGRRVAKRTGPGPRQGDVMGVIGQGNAVVGWRNHTQGGGRFWGAGEQLPINAMVWAPLGLLVGLYALINYFLYPTVEDINRGVNSGLAATTIVMFLYLYLVVGLVNTKLPDLRAQKLENKWEPLLWEFMDSRGPMLGEIYKTSVC